jgi:hypothetical protein
MEGLIAVDNCALLTIKIDCGSNEMLIGGKRVEDIEGNLEVAILIGKIVN